MPRERKPHRLTASMARCAVDADFRRAGWFADEVNNEAPPQAAEESERGGKMLPWRSCVSAAHPDRGVGNHCFSSGSGSVGSAGDSSVFEELVAAGFSSFFGSSFFSTRSWARSLSSESTVQLETR